MLIGIQGSGKSTFYERKFASTHLRISMDLAGSRARELRLLEYCIQAQLPFVVDNTNATTTQRSAFILPARAAGFEVIGFYFPPDINTALQRNASRMGKQKVPVPAIYRTLKYFQQPEFREGFDQIWEVYADRGEFSMKPVGKEKSLG